MNVDNPDPFAVQGVAFDVIPQEPSRAAYRQGGTLGADRKHWFSAKFFQQCRLFFRYHAGAKMVVDAWVNDDDTKLACESSDDAHRIFLLSQAELAGNRLLQAFNTLNIP
jgi:toxin YhaV